MTITGYPELVDFKKFMERVHDVSYPGHIVSWIYFPNKEAYDNYHQMLYEDTWGFRTNKSKDDDKICRNAD